jgi:hypothetical protein
MSPRNSGRRWWAVVAALVCGSTLAGCSDLYFDRRETVAFGAADAVAANAAMQTIDPWPAAAANRDHSTNGPRAAGAIERYRTGKIIPPQGLGTSSAAYGTAPTTGQGGAPTLATPGSTN